MPRTSPRGSCSRMAFPGRSRRRSGPRRGAACSSGVDPPDRAGGQVMPERSRARRVGQIGLSRATDPLARARMPASLSLRSSRWSDAVRTRNCATAAGQHHRADVVTLAAAAGAERVAGQPGDCQDGDQERGRLEQGGRAAGRLRHAGARGGQHSAADVEVLKAEVGRERTIGFDAQSSL